MTEREIKERFNYHMSIHPLSIYHERELEDGDGFTDSDGSYAYDGTVWLELSDYKEQKDAKKNKRRIKADEDVV